MRTKRGRVGGYELKTDAVRDGKERPAHITTRQYGRMSADEQQYYQQAEKKFVPAVSYSYYFGETKFAARQSYRQWHTMLFEEVGSKWGLQRGEDTSLMTPEERKDHRKKNKRQLERERLKALEETEKAEQEAREAKEKSTAAIQKLNALENAVSEKQRTLDRLTGSEKEAQKELERIRKEKEDTDESRDGKLDEEQDDSNSDDSISEASEPDSLSSTPSNTGSGQTNTFRQITDARRKKSKKKLHKHHK